MIKKRFTLFRMAFLLCAMILGGVSPALADTKTEGFETKTTSTTYNGTVLISTNESDCGISWEIYYGTVSTNDKISGTRSAQMRWYSSATSNYPYIMTTTPVDGLSKVSLKARTSSTDVKMDLSYSADGTTWTVGKTYTFTETGKGVAVSLDIPSGNKYVKFGVSSSSTAPSSGNYKLIVDDVVFTYSTGPSISANDVTVAWNAEGGNIEYTINNPPANPDPGTELVLIVWNDTDTDVDWIRFDSGNNGTLPFTVAPNYDDERSVTETLTYYYMVDGVDYKVSTPITVTQTVKPAPIITVQQDSYTMGKDDTSIQIPYSIENANATSFLSVGFDGNANWTSLNKEIDYEHDIITITTDANSGPERTVNVVLRYPGAENKIVTLTQDGINWPTISYQANPAEGATLLVCNGGQVTSGGMVEPGSWATLYVGLADNYEFDSWTDANDKLDFSNTITTPGTDPKSVTLVFQMPEEDIDIVANLKSNLSEEWVETALADLTENDVFVIVGDNGYTYAMANDKGTDNAPTVVGVTVADGKITSDVAANIQWNISGNATNGYTFYPNGSTDKWLYCTSTNNGVRVGNNANNDFVIEEHGYLYNTATSRYIGIYNSQDWRCYTSINSNIKDQTFAFYKKVSTAPDERAEAELAFDESSYSVELVNAASFNSPVLQNPHELSPITWTSSNETVATVNEGTVTILSEGETTITAAFAGNDDYKPGEASYVLTVQDSRNVPTVAIDDSGITNTNVFDGTAAGSLSAAVTYNDAAIEGASVTWSGDNDEVATIDAATGDVTLVAAGTVTFTATYAGNANYKPGEATYEMTVTYSDPNAPGTVNNPYTVAQAIDATPASGTTDNVYIKGIVSQFFKTSIVDDGSNYRYYISDDGTTTTQLLVYKGKGLNNTTFASADDLQIGDEVVILGKLTTYNDTKEVASGNYIVSLNRGPSITVADATINVDASDQDFTRDLTYESLTITGYSDFEIQYYSDAECENEIEEPDWIEALIAEQDPNIGEGYVLSCIVDDNDGDERTAYLKVYAMNDNEELVYSNLVTITQAKFVKAVTYTLATTITPGKHYIIASGTDGNVYVMGGQKSTNREAVEVEITTKNVISVTDEKICEFIVSKDGAYYTFFDENLNGYLNATGAGGTNNNHLKTLGVNDNKGQWSISIDDGGVATVIANATGRNTMRFNNGNSKLFSCYSSGQQDIYLFEKDNDEGSLVIPIAAACTDGTKCYATFSSTKPFVVPEDLTVSEISIDTDGTMNVENYETGAVVPANTGVMVSAAAGDRSYVANVSTEVGNNVLNGDNRLRPTGDDGISADEMDANDPNSKFYRLTMHNGTDIGFWWGYENGGAFAVAANKAYMVVPAYLAGARQGFGFDDATTGISNVNVNENVNGNVYDLQGRKVNTPTKGLYIVNGKKVVIK